MVQNGLVVLLMNIQLPEHIQSLFPIELDLLEITNVPVLLLGVCGGGGAYIAGGTSGRSGGGGGGGCFMNASIYDNSANMTFTVVVGAGGTRGTSSTASGSVTAGTKGANTTLTLNGTLTLLGEGGGGGGKGTTSAVGADGTSSTSYVGAALSQGGKAGAVSASGTCLGGRGGDTFLAYGGFDAGTLAAQTGRIAAIHGSGGQGGGGSTSSFYNGGGGGAGYARITFKNAFSYNSSNSQTFTTPTASGTFTVPAGIYQIYATMVGAGGRGGAAGGYVEALISVTPGETLTVRVGGTGGSTTSEDTYTTAGINGGGRGYCATAGSGITAYGGGGYSGIFRSTTPLAIAGGGGGGDSNGGGAAAGGALSDNNSESGATPGTQSAGGISGGAYLVGGDASAFVAAGGGGGGGYYGGGGGGASGLFSGGGAGGSNYIISTAAGLYSMSGYNDGGGGSWDDTYGSPNNGGRVIIYY